MRKSIKKIQSSAPSQTKTFAALLAKRILAQPSRRALVVGLMGELGSGKTTFAQGFAKGLGIKERILSPTFVIMKKFTLSYDRVPSRMTGQNPKFQNFYHIDCYRLEQPSELLKLGWKDIVSNPNNIVLVEWADRVKTILPKNSIKVLFSHEGKNKRAIALSGFICMASCANSVRYKFVF